LDDAYLSPERTPEVARQVIEGGADLIQLRAKRWDIPTLKAVADEVFALTRRAGIPLIINDHVEVASNYDGVHIGEEDTPYAVAREILGEKRIVGVSCYDSLERALRLQEEGAQYVAFSSPYPSPTKPDKRFAPLDLIAEAARRLRIPFYVIGGIDVERAAELRRAGAYGIAVVSAVLLASDPREATRRLRNAIYGSP